MTKLYRFILTAMLAAAVLGLGARAHATEATPSAKLTNPSVYWKAFGPSNVNRVTFRHCGEMWEDDLATAHYVRTDGKRVTFRCEVH